MRDINNTLLAALTTGTGRPGGNGDVPPNAERPYFIIYTMISGEPDGSMADESEMRDLIFQLTCVGGNNEQCLWMGDKLEAQRPYLNELPGVMRVIWDQIGNVVREDDNTYIRHDTLRVKWSSK